MRSLFVFLFIFIITKINLIPLEEYEENGILSLFFIAIFLDLYSFSHREKSRKHLKDIKKLLEDLSTNK